MEAGDFSFRHRRLFDAPLIHLRKLALSRPPSALFFILSLHSRLGGGAHRSAPPQNKEEEENDHSRRRHGLEDLGEEALERLLPGAVDDPLGDLRLG